MECSVCKMLLRVAIAGYARETHEGASRLPKPIKVWRCDGCGYSELFREHEVFGECVYCCSRIVELPYARNFSDRAVRLLTAAMVDTRYLDAGEYVYGCSKCVPCFSCHKPLPAQDFECRGDRTPTYGGREDIKFYYLHHDCARKLAAQVPLNGRLIGLKDLIDRHVNYRRAKPIHLDL